MKFKVGDRVRVKSREWYDSNEVSGRVDSKEAAYGFVGRMSDWCSKILNIRSVEGNFYKVEENTWNWHDFMLEDEPVTNIPMWPTAEDIQKVKEAVDKLLALGAEEASTLPLYSDTQHDPVNHPDHYTSGGMQCWDAIKASMTHEAFCGYLKGNVQKYIWRYEKKVNPVEDLRKAAVYLNKLIEEVESGSESN